MGGDRQSEQRDEAPTTPDAGNTEPPDCGNQADDQSNEASATPQQPRRRRFLLRLRKRGTTDNAEQASSRDSGKKARIGLLGIIITALIGFFFGIGSNQVTDYIQLARDCSDALSKYSLGVQSHYLELYDTNHESVLPRDQLYAMASLYNNAIAGPSVKIRNDCPMNDRSGYLQNDDVNRWNADYKKLSDCWITADCSRLTASEDQYESVDSTVKLQEQARVVPQWGLLRRAKYEVTHLY